MEIILDDVVESSEHRYGKPCWYKREDVGMDAINDAVLMENKIYYMLERHFSKFPSYLPIVECFHDIFAKTAVGQRLDGFLAGNGKPRLELFTMDTYRTLIKGKIVDPIYLLPGTVGLYFAEKFDPEVHRRVNTILSELGYFFGAQNDILDCYGDPLITGKKSTDIARGNCTWLAVRALEQATPIQKDILRKHYGKPGRENAQKVRNLYDELGLLDEFLTYEKKSFDAVQKAVQEIPNDKHRKGLFKIVEAAY